MTYRLAFFFRPGVGITLEELGGALKIKGEKTFEMKGDDEWFHKRYGSTVSWSHDPVANVFTALVSGGEAVRTCGSLVEWMLRNVEDYLSEHGPMGLQGVSVYG